MESTVLWILGIGVTYDGVIFSVILSIPNYCFSHISGAILLM